MVGLTSYYPSVLGFRSGYLLVGEASLPVFEIGSGAPGVPRGPLSGFGLEEVDLQVKHE